MENDIKRYVETNIQNFKVLSESTNRTMVFKYDNKEYILKQQMLSEKMLSPFWQMMLNVFESDFSKQRKCMGYICSLLKMNPHIPVSTQITKDDELKYQVFDRMAGEPWKPDEFPENDEIEYQLGQYIGFNHSTSYKCCGLPGMNTITDVKSRIAANIEKVIVEYWNSNDEIDIEVRDFYKKIKEVEIHSCGNGLIMADISANQFLFDHNKITACVDLDAYVIGPKEWEIAILENCVHNKSVFKKGYEQYGTFPDMKNERIFYGFIMNLTDIWNKSEMQNFLTGIMHIL